MNTQSSSPSAELERLIKASQMSKTMRACCLETRDRQYALSLLLKAARNCSCPLHHFSVANRRRYDLAQNRWEITGTEAADPHNLLFSAKELKGENLVVIEDCLNFFRDEGGDMRMRMLLSEMLSGEIKSDGLVLVFLAAPLRGDELPSILADQIVRIEVPYPRLDELSVIAREELAVISHKAKDHITPDQIKENAEKVASALTGLHRSAAKEAIHDAFAAAPADFNAAQERLKQAKAKKLSQELAMNVQDTHSADPVLGLDKLMEYIAIHRNRILQHGPGRTRGIVLIGPPGTGKSMIAKSIGSIVGVPLIEFRIGALMESLLGETERRFHQAFGVFEAMAPNVILVDEIEKAMGDSSERDGGTMKRCIGSLLSWLSDNQNPNFIVATANNLGRMGEMALTMTRSERFDACFFVDVPSEATRCEMLKQWLAEHVSNPQAKAKELATITDKFSGADLKSVVKHAVARAQHEGVRLSMSILKAEVVRKRMQALSVYEQFQELRKWGKTYCEPAGPTD